MSGEEHGRIESPGYPEPYSNNEEITWTITVDEHYKIELFFTVFDVEDSYDEDLGGSCVYDFVQVVYSNYPIHTYNLKCLIWYRD